MVGFCMNTSVFTKCCHRRTSQGGWGGLQPPQTRAKPLFFGQKLNFSGRSQQPKMKKKLY